MNAESTERSNEEGLLGVVKNRDIVRLAPEKPVPLIYTNSAQFRSSIFDITISLGSVRQIDDQNVVVEEVATLVMSPQHALVFSELLAQNVANYEKVFGNIPRVPVDDTNLSESQFEPSDH